MNYEIYVCGCACLWGGVQKVKGKLHSVDHIAVYRRERLLEKKNKGGINWLMGDDKTI